jgi:hypothetical protein
VQGHDPDRVVAGALVQVHDQRHVLQIAFQRVEGAHRLDELLQVLKPRLAGGPLVEAQGVGIAALLQHRLQHALVRGGGGQGAPAVQVAQEVAQRRAGASRKLVAAYQHARRLDRRQAFRAGDVQQLLHRGVADAALGRVDDALEGQVVVGRLDQAQIGVGVADLGPFEEARAADHLVGDLQHHEALFEGAHLERGAHQDGHLAVLAAGPFAGLDRVGDHPALGLAVPDAADLDLLAAGFLGPQGLAQAVLVGVDQAGGGSQDVARWSDSCAPA